MGRSELERLSREELIELVLRLQRPEKTSRTSSKPPATDRKEQREHSKPGGAKPGHEGHSRVVSDDPDTIVQHRPEACACCGASLHAALPAEVISVAELNRPGFSGGRLVWLRRPRLGPRPGHNSVPPPRREGCGRLVRAADGG